MSQKKVAQHPIRMYLDYPCLNGILRVTGHPHNGMVAVELVILKEGEPVRVAKEISFYASEWARLRPLIDRVVEGTKQTS